MPSLVFTNAWDAMIRGNLDMDGGTFKCMLTTAAFAENKETTLNRSQVTNEVAAGNGYAAGGNTVTATVTKGTGQITIQLGGTTWTAGAGQTLTARKAVYYLSTGTPANDLVVAVIDFGTDQVAANGTLTLNASTITLSNP